MRLLRRGVGVKAIGDVLGHRDLESTCVYLRLDIDSLRDVALEVPASNSTERWRVAMRKVKRLRRWMRRPLLTSRTAVLSDKTIPRWSGCWGRCAVFS